MTLINQWIASIPIDQIHRLFRRYQGYVYAVISLGIAVTLIMQLIPAKWALYQATLTQKNQLDTLLVAKRRQPSDPASMRTQLADKQAQINRIESTVFSPNGFSAFSITVLPELIQSTGLRMTKITYDPVQPISSVIDARPIKLTLEGGYASIIQFIQAIEQFDKTLAMQSLSIRRTSLNPLKLTTTCQLIGLVQR